ncbi:MAG TPA: DegT/DnrJ/EryC1/StrS family aminotransferase [Spirochaetales bacterium]|nr:DegT/DnrJ/EryC1/StrS family aminotransferase [Spirochaetales bacterium]
MSSPAIKYDLQIKHGNEYGHEEEAAILEVLRQGAPTSGVACQRFEQEFAAYCGTKYARVVSNGTAPLFLSLLAAGVARGDRVLTTPITWIATAAAAVTLGAEVDFVDIDPLTFNLDPEKLKDKITPNTKAVIPVHLYGQCCDMDPILAMAEESGFTVIEDACHAVGGEYKGRKAGSMGTAGCFSFHEQKNISTLGEGGMVVTNDPAIYERFSLYRSHCTRVYGESTKYCRLDESKQPMGKRFWFQDFDDVGYNFRMTDIQAAVGSIQLTRLDTFNQRRMENAAYLTEGLKGVPGLALPEVMSGNKHVFHLYPVLQTSVNPHFSPKLNALKKDEINATIENKRTSC